MQLLIEGLSEGSFRNSKSMQNYYWKKATFVDSGTESGKVA